MRVLVCGGRHADYRDWLVSEMDTILTGATDVTIIHGGAPGADLLAMRYAIDRGFPQTCYPADWTQYGPRAGPVRNQLMLDDGKPDLVVAFPGGRGTADMVRRAKAAGVPVREPDPWT